MTSLRVRDPDLKCVTVLQPNPQSGAPAPSLATSVDLGVLVHVNPAYELPYILLIYSLRSELRDRRHTIEERHRDGISVVHLRAHDRRRALQLPPAVMFHCL